LFPIHLLSGVDLTQSGDALTLDGDSAPIARHITGLAAEARLQGVVVGPELGGISPMSIRMRFDQELALVAGKFHGQNFSTV
jgi:hypothetical protein